MQHQSSPRERMTAAAASIPSDPEAVTTRHILSVVAVGSALRDGDEAAGHEDLLGVLADRFAVPRMERGTDRDSARRIIARAACDKIIEECRRTSLAGSSDLGDGAAETVAAMSMAAEAVRVRLALETLIENRGGRGMKRSFSAAKSKLAGAGKRLEGERAASAQQMKAATSALVKGNDAFEAGLSKAHPSLGERMRMLVNMAGHALTGDVERSFRILAGDLRTGSAVSGI